MTKPTIDELRVFVAEHRLMAHKLHRYDCKAGVSFIICSTCQPLTIDAIDGRGRFNYLGGGYRELCCISCSYRGQFVPHDGEHGRHEADISDLFSEDQT